MLQFKRKQMAAIGAANQRAHIKRFLAEHFPQADAPPEAFDGEIDDLVRHCREHGLRSQRAVALYVLAAWLFGGDAIRGDAGLRSEEHTSELQSLMRISYAVSCSQTKTSRTEYTKHSQCSK